LFFVVVFLQCNTVLFSNVYTVFDKTKAMYFFIFIVFVIMFIYVSN